MGFGFECGCSSGQEISQDAAVDVGETAVDAIVTERELGMVDAQQMENGGVDVIPVDGIDGGFVRPLVALAVSRAAANAAAREPVGERKRVVVPSLVPLAAG